jgi:SAM-dependent methyltransferase
MTALNAVTPHWRELTIHESSPCGASSRAFKEQCPNYVATHLFKNIPFGSYLSGIRCENLEKMTFHDECFDVVITQDVMEHVLNPQEAFAEIARILKPGGMHIFTVPFYDGKKSVIRAVETENGISYLHKPQYHGNPIDEQGSLVTVDWGYDILDYIYSASGMKTIIYSLLDRSLIMMLKILNVFVSKKDVF